MQKIQTLFVRNPEDRRHVLPEVTPGCEWVMSGEGQATRKFDGTCVLLDADGWWARREVKPGKRAPANYRPISTDETTGKTVGWEPIAQSSFAKFHAEAVENCGPPEGRPGRSSSSARRSMGIRSAAKCICLSSTPTRWTWTCRS